MKKSIYLVAFSFILAIITSFALYAKAPAFPTDKQVEKDIRSHWDSKIKILSLQKNPKDNEWHTQVITEDGVKITRAYISFIFKDKDGETVKTDKVTVSYYLNDGIWSFKALGFPGETEETVYEIRSGVKAPERDEVKNMIKEAIEGNKTFDFSSGIFNGVAVPLKVSKVLITEPKFKDHKSNFFFEYFFDFEAVDKKGKTIKVTDMKFLIIKKSVSDTEWEAKIVRSYIEKVER